MIRLLFTLILLAALSLGAGWMADHPGEVTVHWLDWRIDTSFAFLALVSLLAAFAFWLLIGLLRGLIRAPRRLAQWRNTRHYAKGLQAVTEGMAALMIADVSMATKAAKRAQNQLGSQPITLLMQAQIARLKGDHERMTDLLESMLKHPETRFLAARSLADHALKTRSAAGALPYAQQAAELQPRDAQATVALLGVYLRLQRFDEAILLVQRAQRQGALKRAAAKRLLSLVHWQQAMKLLENNDAELALHSASQAWKLGKGFLPYGALLARAYWKGGDEEAAFQLMRQMWKSAPHPVLADLFFDMFEELSPEALIKKAEKLAGAAKTHELSHLLLAQAYAKTKRWQLARKAAKDALAVRESEAALKLMSDIENGEYGDFDAAHQWLRRASETPAEPFWRCTSCHTPFEEWQVLCPSCGAVDSLAMQPPYNRKAAEPVFEFTE